LTPLGLRLKRVKATNHEVISGALQKLKKLDIYIAVGVGKQKEIKEACKAEVIQKRYVST
jgi:hypothetical protein